MVDYRASSRIWSWANADTTLVLPKPTGMVEGDYFLVALSLNSGNIGSVTAPTGFTRHDGDVDAEAGLEVWGKFAGSSEPADYTWSWGSGGGVVIGSAYTGVDSSTPVGGVEFTPQSANSATRTTPPVTTTAAGVLVGVFADMHGSTWTAVDGTIRQQYARTNAASLALEDSGTDVPAGTHTRTATASFSSDRGVHGIIALNAPAAPSGGTVKQWYVRNAANTAWE